MRRVFVTGATGFIGRHALAPLLEHGYEVHATARHVPVQSDVPCHWHQLDLFDSMQTALLLRTICPTDLLHLAWITTPGQYWTSPDNFAWVSASLDLLHHFHEAGGQRVVMAGTCAEYDWRYGYCSEGITPMVPQTPYGTCKLALQTMLEAYARNSGLSSAWGRIFWLYGPHESPVRLVASVIHALLQGEPARCTAGRQIRDFLHVLDVAHAFVALLDSPVTGSINLASGVPVRLKDVIMEIAVTIGRTDLVQLDALPTPPNDPPFIGANTHRLHHDVGWSPRYDLHSGLNQTIEWWQHRIN